MTSIRDHSFHLDSPGQSYVMERAGVLNVLYSQCREALEYPGIRILKDQLVFYRLTQCSNGSTTVLVFPLVFYSLTQCSGGYNIVLVVPLVVPG